MKRPTLPKAPLSAEAASRQTMQYCSACLRTVNVQQPPDRGCSAPEFCRRHAARTQPAREPLPGVPKA